SMALQQAKGLTPFVSMETQYNLLVRDAEERIIPELRARKMSLLPYFPLANGLLTGKYRPDTPFPAGSRYARLRVLINVLNPADHWSTVEKLKTFAAERGMTMVELSIAWLLPEPVVASVIAGATSPEQVAQNAAAADKRLTADDLADLRRLL